MLFNKKYLNIYIIAIIVMVAIFLALIVPSSDLVSTDNGTVLIASDQSISFSQILTAPIDSLIGNSDGVTTSASNSGKPSGAISLVLLVLAIGSFVSVCTKVGIFDNLINAIVESGLSLTKVTILLITYFTISGIVYGLYETAICYLPVLINLYKKYEVKPVFAIKLLIASVSIGYMASPINPFATVIGDQIAGVDTLFGFRTIFMITLFVVTLFYLLVDLKKYNPTHTIVDKQREGQSIGIGNIILFLIPYIYMTIGFIQGILFSATNPQVTMVFLVTGFIIAKYNGMTSDQSIDAIISGINNFMVIAISITLARSVYIILLNGHVIDPIIYTIANSISSLNFIMVILLIAALYMFLAYAIPSPSALGMMTLPIIVPTLVLVGISPEVSVTIYLITHGLSKMYSMTSPLVIACLDEGAVTYNQYIKELRPLLIILSTIGLVMIFSSYLIF